MKKNYEVSVTAYASVLVIAAESEEKAMEYACSRLRFGDFEMDEAKIEKELKTDEEVERARLYVQAVSEDE